MLVKLSRRTNQFSKVEGLIFTILLLPIVFSFSQLGHVTNLPLIRSSFIINTCTCNILMDGITLSFMENKQKINGLPHKERMHLFGQIAAFIVGILIACGLSITLLLFKDFNTLINTPYGHGFIIKIVFVLSILLLAAFNKWYFTPRLQDPKFAKQLAMPFYLKCR